METVTLKVSERVTREATYIAKQTRRPVEDVLTDWLEQMVADLPVPLLPDAEVLQLCDIQMPPQEQAKLEALLDANREGTLSVEERECLDTLMQTYRRGLVRKAQAWQVAVERGLRDSLSNG
jgi:hypothetical protein